MNNNIRRSNYHKGLKMNISSIENDSRKNLFIKYSNSFMSNPTQDPSEIVEKTQKTVAQENRINKSMGLETLTTFSIFPKQVVAGKTIITA